MHAHFAQPLQVCFEIFISSFLFRFFLKAAAAVREFYLFVFKRILM
jgi:hypothetical protein